jgi:hypothetical protein
MVILHSYVKLPEGNLEHIGDFFLSWGGSTETKWMSLTNLFLLNGVSMMTKPMDDLWSYRGQEGPAQV